MDIKVIFKSAPEKEDFIKKWDLESSEEWNELEAFVPWTLLHHVKTSEGVEEFSQSSEEPEEHEFIVKGELSSFESLVEVIKDMGDGWFHVKSSEGIKLAEEVDSIEVNDVPLKFLGNIISLSSNEGESTSIDPESVEAQWPRIRTISRYRPLMPKFALHELTYSSKPELYIMDSGINFDHDEFDVEGLEKENFYKLDGFDNDYSDDSGHGTGVACMAVGKNLGIAQHVKVLNVKIHGKVNGEYKNANLLELGEAIDVILEEVINGPLKTRIVNMSWGVPRSPWLDSKVLNLVNAGVTVVAAAGNGGISVDDISPAGIPEIITVGAIDKYDIPAGFNNIAPSDSGLTTSDGLALDLFAPGDNVVIAGHDSNNSYILASGTSLSAPLVCGVACEISALSSSPIINPTLKDIIMRSATQDALLFEDERFSDNQNRLLYYLAGDPLAGLKETDTVSYLGTHEENEAIVGDLNSALNTGMIKKLFPDDDFIFSIELNEDSLEYAPFISVNSETGLFTIEKPDLPFNEDEKLRMVKFIGKAQNTKVSISSVTVFFFDVNPEYQDNIETDITLGLTGINSISYFGTWSGFNPKTGQVEITEIK